MVKSYRYYLYIFFIKYFLENFINRYMFFFSNVHVIDQIDCLFCRISKTAIGMHSNQPVRKKSDKFHLRIQAKK